GHAEKRDFLIAEQLGGRRVLRPLGGHDLERGLGKLVTHLDCHLPLLTRWLEWKFERRGSRSAANLPGRRQNSKSRRRALFPGLRSQPGNGSGTAGSEADLKIVALD